MKTDLFLKTAEDICGPYVWKIYDMLVLPPSFPFGGMENPCLTFITPTLLVRQRAFSYLPLSKHGMIQDRCSNALIFIPV